MADADLFAWLTPITYWVLVILWSTILLLYIREIRIWQHASTAMKVLLLVLCIDSIRTLFESVYFGGWYTARVGILPIALYDFLVQPRNVFVPKLVNVVAAIIILTILLRQWLPRLAAEREIQARQIEQLESEIYRRKKAEKSMKDTMTRYKSLFEAANDAIFLMEGERFIECNSKTLEIFKCTTDQIIGQPPYDFSPERQPDGRDSKEKALEKIEAVLNGSPQVFEWQHRTYDGIPFDAEVSLNQVDLAGKPFIQAIVRNISDRKREETLRERYEFIVNTVKDPMSFISTGYVYKAVNDEWCRTLQKSREDVIGETVSEVWGLDVFKSRFQPNLDRCFGGEMVSYESLMDLGELGERHCRIIMYPYANIQRKITHVVVVIRDITEQKHTEVELRKLSSAVKDSPSSVIITDREGLIEYVNPKFVEVFGYELDEVIGKNPRILASGEHSKELYIEMWDRLLSGKDWRGELLNKKKNGELSWQSVLIAPVSDVQGKITHFVALQEDITDRKNADKDLQIRMKELSEVRGAMLNMMEDLEVSRKEAKQRAVTLQKEVSIRIKAEEELQSNIDTLERFRRMAVGREKDMIILKEEINELLSQLGLEKKYTIVG